MYKNNSNSSIYAYSTSRASDDTRFSQQQG